MPHQTKTQPNSGSRTPAKVDAPLPRISRPRLATAQLVQHLNHKEPLVREQAMKEIAVRKDAEQQLLAALARPEFALHGRLSAEQLLLMRNSQLLKKFAAYQAALEHSPVGKIVEKLDRQLVTAIRRGNLANYKSAQKSLTRLLPLIKQVDALQRRFGALGLTADRDVVKQSCNLLIEAHQSRESAEAGQELAAVASLIVLLRPYRPHGNMSGGTYSSAVRDYLSLARASMSMDQAELGDLLKAYLRGASALRQVEARDISLLQEGLDKALRKRSRESLEALCLTSETYLTAAVQFEQAGFSKDNPFANKLLADIASLTDLGDEIELAIRGERVDAALRNAEKLRAKGIDLNSAQAKQLLEDALFN